MRRALALALAQVGSLASIVTIALVGSACTDGTTADTGVGASMQVEGAQFFAGPMPDGPGPAVASTSFATNTVEAGQIGKPISGSLAPGAVAVAMMLAGDSGYWVLSADAPDVSSPTFPSFHASLSFARAMPGGAYGFLVRAVDASGQFGPLHGDDVLTATPFGVPAGELVFTLTWDTEADLDLHVIDPNGAEIFYRDINSYAKGAPGQVTDPNAYLSGGILDVDSNASCVIDGRRQEDVVWSEPPPAGHYVARVDAMSLCTEVAAHWTVRAYRGGSVVAEAQGSSFDSDTRGAHDRGAGVLAVEVDLP